MFSLSTRPVLGSLLMLAVCALAPLPGQAADAEAKRDVMWMRDQIGEWRMLLDGSGPAGSEFDGWFVSKPEGTAWNWKIDEDGSLTNLADPEKNNHNIATERKYHNYELHAEFRSRPNILITTENKGNVGFYLRGRM